MPDAPLNMPEFVKSSEAYYGEIKAELEGKYKGQYVALDFASKNYWVGDSASEALISAKKAYPDKLFYLVQVGSLSAFSIQSLSRGDDLSNPYDYQWSY